MLVQHAPFWRTELIVNDKILNTVLDLGKELAPAIEIRSIEGPRGRAQAWQVRIRDTVARTEERVELPADATPSVARKAPPSAAAALLVRPRVKFAPKDTPPVKVSTKLQPSLLPV